MGIRGTWVLGKHKVWGNKGTGEHGYRGTWVPENIYVYQGNMGTGIRVTYCRYQGNRVLGEQGYQGNIGIRGT